MTKTQYLKRFGYSLGDVATICANEFRWHLQCKNRTYQARLGFTDLFGGYQKKGAQHV